MATKYPKFTLRDKKNDETYEDFLWFVFADISAKKLYEAEENTEFYNDLSLTEIKYHNEDTPNHLIIFGEDEIHTLTFNMITEKWELYDTALASLDDIFDTADEMVQKTIDNWNN